jgi:histidine ammonia-lyase
VSTHAGDRLPRPKKRLGQHFLTDPRLLGRIADTLEATRDDTVIEIGPGRGALTEQLLQRAGRVIAIELMTAARGIDLRDPLKPSPITGAVIAELRSNGVAGPGADRFLSPEIEAAAELTLSGRIAAVAQSAATTPLI